MNDAKKTAGAQHCCAVVISACDVTIDLLSRGEGEGWNRERERVSKSNRPFTITTCHWSIVRISYRIFDFVGSFNVPCVYRNGKATYM